MSTLYQDRHKTRERSDIASASPSPSPIFREEPCTAWTCKPLEPHTSTVRSDLHSSTMIHHDSILKGKYPAKAHCAKVAAYLKDTVKDDSPARIYLQGQKTRMIEDNDEPQPFRSEYLMPTAEVRADLYCSDSVVIFSISLAVICPTAISYTTFPPPLSPSLSPHSIPPPSFGLACPSLQSKLYRNMMLTMFAHHPNSTTSSHLLENPDHPHP